MKNGEETIKMHSGCLWYYGLSQNKLEDVIKQLLWFSRDECNCDAFTAMTVLDNHP